MESLSANVQRLTDLLTQLTICTTAPPQLRYTPQTHTNAK